MDAMKGIYQKKPLEKNMEPVHVAMEEVTY
jgi:hypothetical protein